MSSLPPMFGRRAERASELVRLRPSLLAVASLAVGAWVCFALAIASPYATAAAAPSPAPPSVLVAPAQGEQMYEFTSCTAPDGSSCVSPYGGLDTPLEVGSTVALEFFTSIFASTPITGYVNWGDGSKVSSQTISSGDCQCEFGPFTHTYSAAGTYTIWISDAYDGSESIGPFTVSVASDIFSTTGMVVALGGLLGFGAMVGALASLRGVRPPMSASLPPPSVPTPVTTGFVTGGPGVPAGVTNPGVLNIPPGAPPPGGWPSWAYDYRTSPYQPNPLIQGWTNLVQRFQAEHVGRPVPPPNFPTLTAPAPPTDFAGVFYQPRINPQNGQWAWWNPVTGGFL